MFSGISNIEFRKKFQTERDCIADLLEKKLAHSYSCLHRLEKYLDEYHFRFNRRCFLDSIFDKLISRMTESKPVTYEMLKCALNT